jgi:hypothetical protein
MERVCGSYNTCSGSHTGRCRLLSAHSPGTVAMARETEEAITKLMMEIKQAY